jgi:hypothetical protein
MHGSRNKKKKKATFMFREYSASNTQAEVV